MRTAFKLLISCSILAQSGTVLAQAQSDQAADASSPNEGLTEIFVTAERRTVNVQDLPTAITALSSDDLAEKSVVRLEDLANVTPALSFLDTGPTQNVNIRGIGIVSNSPQVVNGVAPYLDGVFQPPILGANIFYDIASVEVLRGPQGTIVGTSSTGGAIFINSENPRLDAVGGYVEGRLGTYDQLGIQGALNIPVTDNLAIRAAGNLRRRDSFYDDLGPFDNGAGRLDEKNARLGLLWDVGAFRALIKVEWVDRQAGGFAYRPTPGTTYFAGATDDVRDLSYDSETYHNEHAFLSSMELRYETPGGVTFRSVSGYGNRKFSYRADQDATQLTPATNPALPQIVEANDARALQYSQEINILSPTSGALDWILGGYIQRDEIQSRFREFEDGFPTNVEAFPKKDIRGAFAQINYQLSDQLEFQLGGRYSTYHVKSVGGGVFIGRGVPGFPPNGIQVASTENDYSDNKWTGKAAINWKPDDDTLIYAFVARGYKPGGANSPTLSFKPETVLNYELGWKTSWLDDRIRVQADVFYNDYKNFQIGILDTTSGRSGVSNLAPAVVKGAEAQIQGRFGGFEFDAAAAYVDSKLPSTTFVNTRLLPPGTNLPQCGPGQTPDSGLCTDYTNFIITNGGGPNLNSPKWTFNAGVSYEVQISSDWTITPRVNFAYVGSQFSSIVYDTIRDRIRSRGLLSALLTVRNNDNLFELYGTNLTDKEYISGRSGNNEFYGAPREFGIRVSREF